MALRYDDVLRIYEGSDGNATAALYEVLKQIGPVGEVALNVFRANKTSARAKVYKGGIPGQGSYRGMAYQRKAYSIEQLCKVLVEHGEAIKMTWGWGVDGSMRDDALNRNVLYVDLPTGQVSFHNGARQPGPDYSGKWDGVRGESPTRICRWVADVIEMDRLRKQGFDYMARTGEDCRHD